MCLTAKKGIKVADADICVCKVVSVKPGDEGRWYPVFYNVGTPYSFGETHSEFGKAETMIKGDPFDPDTLFVEDGFFHSTWCGAHAREGVLKDVFKCWGGSEAERKAWMLGGKRDIVICDAVIPAGTRYYTDGKDYASEKIIVKKPSLKTV